MDRLPTLVTGLGVHKLLGVPKLVGGTGENTAAAVYGAYGRGVGRAWSTTTSVLGVKKQHSTFNVAAAAMLNCPILLFWLRDVCLHAILHLLFNF